MNKYGKTSGRTRYSRLRAIAGLAILLAGVPITAIGASWESLIMPGPVTQAHSDLEQECGSCHTAFSKQGQKQLCLDCHEDIQADIGSKRGFHGKHPNVASSECRTCHAEHLGRDSDITGLITETFDHDLTDFPLLDAHAIQACDSCHAKDKKFREAPSACVDCHQKHDVHKGALGDECHQCHNPARWTDTRFDHKKATDYALLGAHARQTCRACHIDEHYAQTPTLCIDCHKLDDVHQGSRGKNCQNCHSERGWKQTRFDHLEQTGFALKGAHATLACSACHLENMSLESPPTECIGCHSSNDVHQGSRGSQCADCHNDRSWKIEFDHEKQTGFALLGVHNELRCEQCHTSALTDPIADTCEECHKDEDPHNGTLGACDSCHGTTTWRRSLRFDHEFTAFPLFGMHRLATCEQCHLSRQFDEAEPQCFECHQQDDAHHGVFGQACADCHTPGGWDLWRFDHDAQTKFALTGSHINLVCEACHSESRGPASDLSQQCRTCHLSDDAHGGQFGDHCERCHTTESFSDGTRFR